MRTVISFTLGRGSTPIAHDLAKNKDSSVESSVNCGHSISRNKEQDRRRVNLNSMNITFIIFYIVLGGDAKKQRQRNNCSTCVPYLLSRNILKSRRVKFPPPKDKIILSLLHSSVDVCKNYQMESR